jgi:hypothetical protein
MRKRRNMRKKATLLFPSGSFFLFLFFSFIFQKPADAAAAAAAFAAFWGLPVAASVSLSLSLSSATRRRLRAAPRADAPFEKTAGFRLAAIFRSAATSWRSVKRRT